MSEHDSDDEFLDEHRASALGPAHGEQLAEVKEEEMKPTRAASRRSVLPTALGPDTGHKGAGWVDWQGNQGCQVRQPGFQAVRPRPVDWCERHAGHRFG